MNHPTLRDAPRSASSDSAKAPGLTDRQIGQQIRRHRLLRRLTQGRVAAQMGISYQQLQKYEAGANRISMGRLSSLAEVLNVPVARLLIEDDRPEHPSWPTSRPPSRQEELLRHVAAMAPPFQQAVLRLAKALAADAPAPSAGLRQSPRPGMAGGTGAGAAVLRARRRP
jgi:transcriptional regulator with XRE-family HTH domain